MSDSVAWALQTKSHTDVVVAACATRSTCSSYIHSKHLTLFLDILCLHSMSNDQDLFFDLKRDILAPKRTPLLKATKPNFDVPDSPPPLVPYDPSSDH
jgi:hypothetical protein